LGHGAIIDHDQLVLRDVEIHDPRDLPLHVVAQLETVHAVAARGNVACTDAQQVIAFAAIEIVGAIAHRAMKGPDQRVIAGIAVQRVLPRPGPHQIVAHAAGKPVVAVTTLQHIVAVSADQRVMAVPAAQRVIAFLPADPVVAVIAPQPVIAMTAQHGIVAVAGADAISAASSVQLVIAGAPEDAVLPIAPLKPVISAPARQPLDGLGGRIGRVGGHCIKRVVRAFPGSFRGFTARGRIGARFGRVLGPGIPELLGGCRILRLARVVRRLVGDRVIVLVFGWAHQKAAAHHPGHQQAQHTEQTEHRHTPARVKVEN